ncbi:MAG: hypothetical protein K5767_07750 [Clostridia bacterium]|nr:hypothetical protein [Clostridia bacterium]
MNKNFWNEMARLWCFVVSSINVEAIAEIAADHVNSEVQVKSGYSINPLDDFDEEDDWDE